MAVAVEKITRLRRVALARAASSDQITVDYHRYHSTLRAFLVRGTRTQHDADDLAQEVYLRLLSVQDRESIRSVKAFLLRVAANLLCDRSRRKYTRMLGASVPVDDMEIADTTAEPSRILESRESLTSVAHAVAGLKATTRRAFLLNRLHARSYPQIAVEMGISKSMVEKHVSAAIAALRVADECES